MERKELICIGCPLGCNLTVEMDGGQVVSVNEIHASAEMIMPERN